MTQTVKDFDLLDAKISLFNYRNLKRVDWVLAGLVMVLAFIGLAVLYSASRNNEGAGMPFYVRQACYLGIGIPIALGIMCIDSRFLVSIAPVLFGVALILLLSVILFGKSAKGGQRWLPLGPFHLQPSEQTKLIVVYMLVWYLTTIKERIRQFPFLILGFMIVGIPALLIFKQPNLGTALALVPVSFAMFFAAGCRWWHLALIALVGVCLFKPAFNQLKPYQQTRLTAFLHSDEPDKDKAREKKAPETPEQKEAKKKAAAAHWQTKQSKITVGSGGLKGKGFGRGTQSALDYLPEHHTDFIFCLVAEEKGFIGALVVIALYAAFLLRGLKFAADCPDMTGTLLAVGAVTILTFHIFVNIAITIGLMPVTGIPLPFLSYGGNFYVTTMMCVGVLLNVPVRKHLFE